MAGQREWGGLGTDSPARGFRGGRQGVEKREIIPVDEFYD